MSYEDHMERNVGRKFTEQIPFWEVKAPPLDVFLSHVTFGRPIFKYTVIISSHLHTVLINSCSKIKALHAPPCHYLSCNYTSNILNTTQSWTYLRECSYSSIHINLVTIWRRVANYRPRPPYPWYLLNRVERTILPLPAIEPRFLCCPSRNVVTINTLWYNHYNFQQRNEVCMFG